jgi:hypothetical protein
LVVRDDARKADDARMKGEHDKVDLLAQRRRCPQPASPNPLHWVRCVYVLAGEGRGSRNKSVRA